MEKIISPTHDHQQISKNTKKVMNSTAVEISAKVKAAHAAKKSWKELGAQKRVEILRGLIPLFKKNQDEIAKLTCQEMGKPITQCYEDLQSDFAYLEAFFNDGPSYIQDIITVKEGDTVHRTVFEPRGVVASISPWNYPFSNFLWAVIPNLIVGNTVVFKHSEECQLFGKLMEEIMLSLSGLPTGVFAEIYGEAREGQLLVNENIDLIWFTGSSAVGKELIELAGKKQIKAVMELGGSNPGIIFSDVDLDNVVPKIVAHRFTNCGQICDAIKRIIVHRSLHDNFVKKLVEQVEQLKMGDPELQSTQLGPLVSKKQLEKLEAQVQDAIKLGAKVQTGGARPSGLTGHFYQPTVLTNINAKMRVWHEETFGPVLPIMSFENEEEAIRLANDTAYGLGAVIYSKDVQVARRVAAQIDACTIDLNEGSHWRPCNLFGGFKASGMSCEHGELGFRELCRFKVIAE